MAGSIALSVQKFELDTTAIAAEAVKRKQRLLKPLTASLRVAPRLVVPGKNIFVSVQIATMDRRVDRRGSESQFITRRKWLGMLGAGGAVGLAGCNGNEGSSTGDNGTESETDDEQGNPDAEVDSADDVPSVSGMYSDVEGSTFETLNPVFNTTGNAGSAIGFALDSGYTFGPENQLVPLLYDVTTDDNGKTWTIDIRENLEFSDPYGEFTAEDYLYQVRQVHKSEAFRSANSADWDESVQLEQVSEYEIRATLDNANLLWPETFTPLEYPIPRGLLQPYVEAEDEEGMRQDSELLELEFTGNLGAYTLDEWVRDGGTSYTRNDEYYLRDVADENDEYQIFANSPYFEAAEIQVIEEQSSRVAARQTGDADHVSLPPSRGQEFIDADHSRVVLAETPFNNILSVNMRDNGWTAGPGNLFRVTEFRQALAAAIDKQELIEGVYRGFGNEHYTWQPEFSEWFPGTDELMLFGNPEEGVYGDDARELAEQALDQIDQNYRYEDNTLVTPEGDSVELELYYNAASNTQELAADIYDQSFQEHLGIALNSNSINATRYSEEYWQAADDRAEPGTTAEYQGSEFTWEQPNPNNPGPREFTSNQSWDFGTIFGLNTYPLNPLTNQVFFDGAGAFYNPVGYYPEFDAEGLFQQAREAETREELQEIFREIFINLNQEQPYIMLRFGEDIEAYNPDLVGPIGDFANGWDFSAWHLEE
jgi:peptide/nickel transport system substrate-binding protein